MIPEVIGDLQERVPPLDVPPSEGLATGGTSRHCGTSPNIDFDQRRQQTTSRVRYFAGVRR